MKNISLNPGGVIGAVLLLVAVIVTVVLTSHPGQHGHPSNTGQVIGGLGVLAVFVGAAGGNYIWGRCFSNHK